MDLEPTGDDHRVGTGERERLVERQGVHRDPAHPLVGLLGQGPVGDEDAAPHQLAQVGEVLDLEPVELGLVQVWRIGGAHEEDDRGLDESIGVSASPKGYARGSFTLGRQLRLDLVDGPHGALAGGTVRDLHPAGGQRARARR